MPRPTRSTTGPAVVYLSRVRHTRASHPQQGPREVQQVCETTLLDYIAQEEYARAVDVLVQQYQDAVISYCYVHCHDWPLAQEVAQEIFLAAFEALARFRGESSVQTWLYGVASKKCLEMGRTRTRRERLLRNNLAHIAATAHCNPPRQPEDLLAQEQQRQQVWQALRRLRVYDRELLVLRYLEDLTREDIARILRVSRRTVERHLPRAEAKFLKAYEKVRVG